MRLSLSVIQIVAVLLIIGGQTCKESVILPAPSQIAWRKDRSIPVEMNEGQECSELYEKAVAANSYQFRL